MRSQIRGLHIAYKNSQDTVSMIQVEEGALGEVHSMLQRARELSVQAANGTNTDDDKIKLQNEIKEITEEVDRISETTEFNNIKLLNKGNNSIDVSVLKDPATLEEYIVRGLRSGWLQESIDLIESEFGHTPSTRNITVKLDQGTAGGILAFVQIAYTTSGDDSAVTSLELHIELAEFAHSTSWRCCVVRSSN